MSDAIAVAPLVKKLVINASPEKAFHHFTKNIHVWWPLASHSLSRENAKTVMFEATEGGRIYEIERSGKEREWGRVMVCEPPHRLAFSWVLEAPEKATQVEVSFEQTGIGKTALTLTHSGWEHRPDGAEWRPQYDKGWDGVLIGYASAFS